MMLPAESIDLRSLTEAMAKELHRRQLECWPLAARNFEALAGVEQRVLMLDGVRFVVQHNPARALSTGAKIDAASIAQRKCFLCRANRPAEQLVISLDEGYDFLVNPYPIFPYHFTIAATGHTPQLMLSAGRAGRLAQMMELALAMPSFAVFYNGPTSGASAPDHFHFQAVERSYLPLFRWIEDGDHFPYLIHTALFSSSADAEQWLREMIGDSEGNERPMNLFAAAEGEAVRLIIVPRSAHRPPNYGSDPDRIMVSPGAIDVAGTIIAPRALDYHTNLTPATLLPLLRSVTYSN